MGSILQHSCLSLLRDCNFVLLQANPHRCRCHWSWNSLLFKNQMVGEITYPRPVTIVQLGKRKRLTKIIQEDTEMEPLTSEDESRSSPSLSSSDRTVTVGCKCSGVPADVLDRVMGKSLSPVRRRKLVTWTWSQIQRRLRRRKRLLANYHLTRQKRRRATPSQERRLWYHSIYHN